MALGQIKISLCSVEDRFEIMLCAKTELRKNKWKYVCKKRERKNENDVPLRSGEGPDI